jgi:hypothetical protein
MPRRLRADDHAAQLFGKQRVQTSPVPNIVKLAPRGTAIRIGVISAYYVCASMTQMLNVLVTVHMCDT